MEESENSGQEAKKEGGIPAILYSAAELLIISLSGCEPEKGD